MALAKRRGAKRLILSDPLRSAAQSPGGSARAFVIDPSKEHLRERVMTLTRDRGADVVAEAVGKPELVAEAMTLVKPGGCSSSWREPQGQRDPAEPLGPALP